MSTVLDDGIRQTESAPKAKLRDLAQVMRGFQTPLSARQIEQSVAQTSSIQTMEFFWHCAADINNRSSYQGARESTYYSELPRMTLIPLFAWPAPVIRPKNAHFSVGRFNEHGSSLGPTGVVITQRSMLSGETRRYFEKWYGHVGGLTINCLATDKDTGKAEALLLYEAVMTNTRPGGVPGCELVIEDLPTFLEQEAPLLLEHAFEFGVEFQGSTFWPKFPAGHYALDESLRPKGLEMIAELARNVDATIDHVMNEETGVLVVTRGQMMLAAAGVKDSKVRADRRDEFYLRQFPSFNMNSPEERAIRASAPTVQAIKELAGQRGENEGLVASALLASLEELKAMRQEQASMAAELAALKRTEQPQPNG